MVGLRWSPSGPEHVPGRNGEYVRLVTSAPLLEVDTGPLQRVVDDLVRRFDPGGYQLQCPVAGCGAHWFVPRMELDPLEPLDRITGDYVVHAEGVPREDLELVLGAHLNWHAVMTETDVHTAPLPLEAGELLP